MSASDCRSDVSRINCGTSNGLPKGAPRSYVMFLLLNRNSKTKSIVNVSLRCAYHRALNSGLIKRSAGLINRFREEKQEKFGLEVAGLKSGGAYYVGLLSGDY